MSEENNPFPGEENTGHIWDDNLRELSNDPPTWWRMGFHASWILVVVYSILYPTWPLISSHTTGIMGWTQIGEYKEDLKAIEQVRAVYEEQLADKTAADIIASNDDLTSYTVKSAKVLFGDNCAPCHGNGGAGGPDYPVLADDDWMYGGTHDVITQTITAGRKGIMPAQNKTVSASETDELANAILAGNPTSTPLYMSKGCIACHGPEGKGLAVMGSANLTDSIWRFASDDQLASIKTTIAHGVNDPVDAESRQAEMPAFGDRLSATDIKKLTVYVHKLGGGQ